MKYQCIYCGRNIDAGRFLIRFPLNDEQLLKSWLKNLGLNSTFKPPKAWRLCSDHFAVECVQLKEKKLFCKSIPTLFDKRIWQFCLCCGVHQYDVNCPSLHTFPTNDEAVLKMWLQSTRSRGIVPSPTSLICSNHFEDNCFRNHERRKGYLKKSAVPTIFEQKSFPNDLCVNNKKQTLESEDLFTLNLHLGKPSLSLNNNIQNVICDNLNDQQTPMELEVSVIEDSSSRESNDMVDNANSSKDINITVQTISSDHNYATSPRKLKRKLFELQENNKKLKNDIRTSHQTINRMQKTISSLTDIVSELKKTKPICETGFACLESIANNDNDTGVDAFLKRYCRNACQTGKGNLKSSFKERQGYNNSEINISREQYPPSLRSFAMTLHFYSPKAYSFVRRKFCFALPHTSSLRAWYSTINCEPGFTAESFNALKNKVEQAKKEGKEVLVSLISDEIGIKKGLQYLPNGCVRG